MPLIQINAEFKALLTVLERIARACEMAVGIVPAPVDAKEPEYDPRNPAVTYSDNAALLREEWRAKAGLPEEEEPLL